MVRARTDDNKQILTISLVLFVILSLILGGVAYLGYAGQNELEKEKADLKTKYDQARKDADTQTMVVAMAHAMIGIDDKKDLDNLKGLKRTHQKDFDTELGRYGKELITWDANQDLPAQNLMGMLDACRKKLDAAEKGKKMSDDQRNEARQEYERKIKEKDKALNDLDEKLKATSKAIEERGQGLQAEYDKALKALKDALPDNDANLKKIKELEAEKAKVLADLKKARDDMEIKIKKLEDKIPQVDLLAYDQPKGKVVTVDKTQQTCYLNLGTADYVKPGLTFSVFGEGEYKPTAERKASVEIVNVTGDHMCMARVTEIKNAARKPIVTGDQLYNPGWFPGLRDHVAIAGLIDLNGDGRDATPEFVKALEKQGVIVDAWLDLKDQTLKGALKAVGPKTSYLIIGDEPEVDKELVGNQIDPRLEKKLTFRQVIHDLKEDAKAKGVYVVDARRYMALAGMKVPKPASEFSSYIIRPDAKVPGDQGGDKKKEEMKKDDAKKDDKKEDKEK
jgi:hypothetical protein